MLMTFIKGKPNVIDSYDDVYELMIKQLKIRSILDLKIKWSQCFSWLGYFSWVSRSQENVINYLRKRGYPAYE